jgi:hypothetical protein
VVAGAVVSGAEPTTPRRRNREGEARQLLRAQGGHLWSYRLRVLIIVLVGPGGFLVWLGVAVPPAGWATPFDAMHDDVRFAVVLVLVVLWSFGVLALTGLSGPVFWVRVLLEEGVARPRVREVVAAARSGAALRRAVEREVAPIPTAIRDAVGRREGGDAARRRDIVLRERRWLAEGGIWPYVWLAPFVALGVGIGTVRAGSGFLTVTMLWAVLGAAAAQLLLASLPVGQSFSSLVVRPGRLSVWSIPRHVDLSRVVAFGTVELSELKTHVARSQSETWRTFATWRPWCAVHGGWYALQRSAVIVRIAEHPPAGLVWLTELRPDGRPLGWVVGTSDPAALLDALERAGARGRLDEAAVSWSLPEVAAAQVLGDEEPR